MNYDLQNQEETFIDSRRQFPREETGGGEPQSGEEGTALDNSWVQSDQRSSWQSNDRGRAAGVSTRS